jgi:prolipoprotein diacylglyceryltransferase
MTNSWIDPVLFELGPLQVRWYGLMYVAGFAVGSWLLGRLAKSGFWPLPKETIDKWNKYLDFDLHTKLNGEYGFTGAKRLYNIFGL